MRLLSTLIILLLFSLTYCINAQTKDSIADALRLQIKEAVTDSIRIPLELELAYHFRTHKIDSSEAILNDVLKRIDDQNYTNSYYKKQKAFILNVYGILASKKGNKEDALQNYLESLKMSEHIKDSNAISYTNSNIGNLYRRQNNFTEAKQYYKKALKIREKIGGSEELAEQLNSFGILYALSKKKDSALYYYHKAKQVDTSITSITSVNLNIAAVHFSDGYYSKAAKIYKKNIPLYKKLKWYNSLSSCFLNLGVVYTELDAYDDALILMDSAILYSKLTRNKDLLLKQYLSKANINERKGDYQQAFTNHKIYKVYSDSLNDINEIKRFTELELNYKFDKEREVAAVQLESEASKKKLYFILLLIMAIASLILFYLIRKNNKQKLMLAANEIELGQLEKIKGDLALANRENELKKVIVENSITKEVLNNTLEDIKQIITFVNEKEGQVALRSLSAALLSEKAEHKSSSDLQLYLDEVNMDFKILLDTHFTELKLKEKELLYLMKVGLSNIKISMLLNTTLPAVKSSRYRIRKKLGLNSNDDIIAFIDSKSKTQL